MNVIRWGVAVGVALTTVAAAVVAPSAFAAGGADAVGMSEHGTALIAFSTANPKGAKMIGGVKGMGDERLIGIDYKPGGGLYGVGTQGTVYRIDSGSATAKSVGKLSTKPSGTYFDIDFAPNGDLRIISDNGQNMHQPFGADGPAGATVADGKLSRKNIAAMAYDGGGGLIDLDSSKAQLLTQNPTTGALTGLGKPGAFPKISTSSNGLDIGGGGAFAVVNLNHVHTLFSVNPSDGTAKKVGAFQGHVIDLALKR